ncbi:HlyU family transcriptional regulator [Photobacterium lipolyticum]|uniref:Transcriptional regulator n=1 Tax=Photobacterium lipolyticum TaxID=266810 RepID=A0A2T3MZJ7_9GAMM|nr:HlyU family transcriptional regulator [Photobacterium lipolyticum]PSW05372.1 transcriptional regulator [Photobacterium lipolyticum]
MGFFSKLFGLDKKKKTVEVEPVEYEGYLIYPEPIAEGGQFRIAGRICKQIDGEVKTHTFVRSDLLSSRQDAETFMLNKAKMFIDQNGDTMFGN